MHQSIMTKYWSSSFFYLCVAGDISRVSFVQGFSLKSILPANPCGSYLITSVETASHWSAFSTCSHWWNAYCLKLQSELKTCPESQEKMKKKGDMTLLWILGIFKTSYGLTVGEREKRFEWYHCTFLYLWNTTKTELPTETPSASTFPSTRSLHTSTGYEIDYSENSNMLPYTEPDT